MRKIEHVTNLRGKNGKRSNILPTSAVNFVKTVKMDCLFPFYCVGLQAYTLYARHSRGPGGRADLMNFDEIQDVV